MLFIKESYKKDSDHIWKAQCINGLYVLKAQTLTCLNAKLKTEPGCSTYGTGHNKLGHLSGDQYLIL